VQEGTRLHFIPILSMLRQGGSDFGSKTDSSSCRVVEFAHRLEQEVGVLVQQT
jgi:hypothetical protein